MQEEDSLNRFRGMLAGHFLGDALGAPYEFSRGGIKLKYYSPDLIFSTTYYSRAGQKNLEVAQFTDDSEMTITMMRTLLQTGKEANYLEESFIQAYLNWANSGTWCLGRNTRALFKGIKTVNGYRNRTRKMDYNNQSNGSLMKVSPFALLPEAKRIPLLEMDTNLTHRNPVVLEANIVYTAMLARALEGAKSYDILQAACDNLQSPELIQVYSDAIANKPRDVTGKTKGWLLHAFYCAVWVAAFASNYRDYIAVIIKMGGDTDTNAAIAGAIIGAKIGYRALWQEESSNLNQVLGFSPDFGRNPRPAYYLANDFMELTQEFFQTFAT
jgi:ADP-ribosylglycohydrolase